VTQARKLGVDERPRVRRVEVRRFGRTRRARHVALSAALTYCWGARCERADRRPIVRILEHQAIGLEDNAKPEETRVRASASRRTMKRRAARDRSSRRRHREGNALKSPAAGQDGHLRRTTRTPLRRYARNLSTRVARYLRSRPPLRWPLPNLQGCARPPRTRPPSMEQVLTRAALGHRRRKFTVGPLRSPAVGPDDVDAEGSRPLRTSASASLLTSRT